MVAEFSLLVSIYGQFPDLATKSLASDSVGGGVGVGRSVLSTVLYCTVWAGRCCPPYCTVLYCIVLYCTVLYCVGVGRSVLSTVLYCTVLYCTVLYCTVLCCTALYCVGVGRSVLSTVLVFCHGWGHYLRHKVRTAGLGLALLYMTVLGFDTITWSYALLQVRPALV